LVNVICAGITGCKKETVVSSVLSVLNKTDSKGLGGLQNVEDILQKKRGIKWGLFLRSLHLPTQDMYARDILAEAISTLEDHYKHRFLNLHLTLYHNNRFFAPFPLDAVKGFRPDLMVTLIDDAYASWARVKKKSDSFEDPVRTVFRLGELLAWRSVEIMMADFMAKALGIRNYVVAVKHPPEMLFSLIFHPEKLIAYIAYPISRFRRVNDENRARLAEEKERLDSFIRKLQEKFVVFNPTTIDERVLRGLKGPLQSDVRWKLPHAQMVDESDIQFPLPLPEQEIAEIHPVVDSNIKFRDFRLIYDVDCLVAYRPYWDKGVHEGIKAEIDQAQNLMIDAVHHFPPEDGGIESSPFEGQSSGIYGSEEDVIEDLEKRGPRYERPWGLR